MRDLVVQYLKDRYFGENEKEITIDNRRGNNIDGKGKHPKNIEHNINLLKRLLDRQFTELNKKIDSMAN